MEQNHLDNLIRVPYGGHLREINLNVGQLFRKRCCFKIFSIFSSGAILFEEV